MSVRAFRRVPGGAIPAARAALIAVAATVASAGAGALAAQPPQAPAGQPAQLPAPPELREGALLDLMGRTSQARKVFQGVIDSAATPLARATAQRAMALSYAFDGDCRNVGKYEQRVIDYWKTREPAEPQNAFYQEGEIADEAARICLDAGDLPASQRWYRTGYELGTKEPAPQTHPRSLWDFRLAHALGRIAARRGDAAEAQRQIAAARHALDSDTAMARQQERFFPYLVGYVALYTNDLPTAETQLTKAVELSGPRPDPFLQTLLAMTYERMGQKQKADELYRQAYDAARAHNPPSAFVRRYVRAKLKLHAGE